MTPEVASTRILVGTLVRSRRLRVSFADRFPPPLAPPTRRPADVAKRLALAHHIQRAIDEGRVSARADVADRLNLTRARMTQILDLLLLAPDIQADVLALEAVDGIEPLSERGLRKLSRIPLWSEQRRRWRDLRESLPRNALPLTSDPVLNSK